VSDRTNPGTWQSPAGVWQTTEAPPMTRRELREREAREAEALAAQTASVPGFEQPSSAPPVEQAVEQFSSPQPSHPVIAEPPVAPMTRRERREMEERLRQEQERGGDPSEVVVPSPQPGQTTVDSVVSDVVDYSEPVQRAAWSEPKPGVTSEAPSSAAVLPPVFDTPVTSPRSGFPIDFDDFDADEAELASSREVGAGSPATHALILPTTPTIDISGPIGDTGEILITGQIPLPRLVTETGVQGEFDEEERFDELIGAETTPVTSPVSARSAVSSKGNDSEFQMVRKAPWGTAATVLGASAVLLVLAAAGLLTVALLTDLLTWPF